MGEKVYKTMKSVGSFNLVMGKLDVYKRQSLERV